MGDQNIVGYYQQFRMVREERLELSQVALLEPKSSASTSSATLAMLLRYTFIPNQVGYYSQLNWATLALQFQKR